MKKKMRHGPPDTFRPGVYICAVIVIRKSYMPMMDES